MPYVGKKPADIIATAVDTTTGTFSGEIDAASLDISGNIDVDGTTNLDVVDIDGALTQDGGAVFNEGSADVDFRVESNGNANMLVVDGGTDTVIIGHNVSRTTMFNSTVGGSLQVEGTTAEGATVSIARNSNDDNGPNLVLAKSNGTANAAVTVVTDDALLGRISWQGADGSQTVEAARIEGFVDGTPGANDMPGRLTFSTTADGAATVTERVRIHTNGVASFNNGIALGVGTANTASNVLDDYEEGTFTASLYGSTSGTGTNVTTTASYIKVGKQVTIGGYFQNVNLSSMSGSTQINGLPFTSNAETSNYNTGNLALYGFDFTGFVTPYIGNNVTNIDILDSRTGAGWAGLAIPAASGKYMIFSLTYKTA